jgi:ABC-type ATPase involved in cell division
MEELSSSGVTIVVVSHNEEQVHAFAPRTIRLEKGRIVSDERRA